MLIGPCISVLKELLLQRWYTNLLIYHKLKHINYKLEIGIFIAFFQKHQNKQLFHVCLKCTATHYCDSCLPTNLFCHEKKLKSYRPFLPFVNTETPVQLKPPHQPYGRLLINIVYNIFHIYKVGALLF